MTATSLNEGSNEAIVVYFIITTASRYRVRRLSLCSHDSIVISTWTPGGCHHVCIKACKNRASSTLAIQTPTRRSRPACLYLRPTYGDIKRATTWCELANQRLNQHRPAWAMLVTGRRESVRASTSESCWHTAAVTALIRDHFVQNHFVHMI